MPGSCLEPKRKKRAAIEQLLPLFEEARTKGMGVAEAAAAAREECVICMEAPKSHVLIPCGQWAPHAVDSNMPPLPATAATARTDPNVVGAEAARLSRPTAAVLRAAAGAAAAGAVRWWCRSKGRAQSAASRVPVPSTSTTDEKGVTTRVQYDRGQSSVRSDILADIAL